MFCRQMEIVINESQQYFENEEQEQRFFKVFDVKV